MEPSACAAIEVTERAKTKARVVNFVDFIVLFIVLPLGYKYTL
jgi:hypothetical protein